MGSATALQIVSELDSLRSAWNAISKRNQLSKGVDNVTIKAFRADLDRQLRRISSELRSRNYQFSQLRPATIAKPGSDKRRAIQIPTIRDRVVMKALARHIEPSFAKFNLPCSFAFIHGKSRGVGGAIIRIQELVNRGYCHYFEADIKNFFGSVNRQTLWRTFAREVRHKSLIPLLEKCFNLELADLEAYQTEYQDIFLGATVGIPQGGVLSPMLANFYLHEFDKTIVCAGFELVRYADDFVVMCKSPEDAQRAHVLCRTTLLQLGLEIHALDEPKSKSRFGYFKKDGLDFLGVRFEGEVTYPQSKVVQRFKQRVQYSLDHSSGENLLKTLQRLANLIIGWGSGYREMRVMKIYGDLDAFVKEEVARYLQRSGIHLAGKNRGKQMRFLGVPSLSAMVAHEPRFKEIR